MDKSEAKVEIQRLVDKFDKLSTSEKKLYNEANTRKNFIMPLFRALGWDVFDDFNKDEVVEEETTISGRLDYAFRLNSNTKFILEAKSISEDLDKEQWSIQAVEYGWNKGIPWVVLSDFEGLKVFNSEWDVPHPRPNLDFKYHEFVERFDDLWLLSKESFQSDLLDEQARKWGITAKRESVNKYLSEDLIEWREILFHYFSLWNKDKKIDVIEESVQRILDRLIFIRVVEDKGLEEKRLWQAFQNWESNNNIPQNFIEKLIPLFRDFDKNYDSNLFDPHECERLFTTQEPFRKIIPDLYADKEAGIKYRFDAIDTDVLGQVYEQYLGYIQGREGDLSKRKKEGIYYTPSYIVGYMVRRTLQPILDKCKTIRDLKKIKILDPACGSGSFLIKAVQVIYEKYLEFGNSGGVWTKTEILLNNIYGVDLDVQAVEIARLNLLINACDKRTRLPELKNNIVNGNSLLTGADTDLESYFDKDLLMKKTFDWKEKFPEVFKQGGFDVVIGNPPYISSYGRHAQKFDKEDIQFFLKSYSTFKKVGNRKNISINTVMLFFEKGIDLLRQGGSLSFIVDQALTNVDVYSRSREWLLENIKINEVVTDLYFPEVVAETCIIMVTKVKPNVNYTLLWKKKDLNSPYIEKEINDVVSGENKVFAFSNFEDILRKVLSKSRPLGECADVSTGMQIIPEYFLSNDESLMKLKKWHKAVFSSNIIQYKVMWPTEKQKTKYITYDNQLQDNIRKILKKKIEEGEDVRTPESLSIGSAEKEQRFYPPKIILSQTVSNANRHISLQAAFDVQGYYGNVSIHLIKHKDLGYLKCLLAIVNSRLISFYAVEKKLILGAELGSKKTPQIRKNSVDKLPIPNLIKPEQKILEDLADRILTVTDSDDYLENERKRDQVEKYEKQIDQMVYKLYGLTQKEIEIVEGGKNVS